MIEPVHESALGPHRCPCNGCAAARLIWLCLDEVEPHDIRIPDGITGMTREEWPTSAELAAMEESTHG